MGYCIDMETKLFTFVRIADGDKVVVLDKVVRKGWEGLTFPGGKVEKNESVRASAIREVREETGLSVDVRYRGLLRNMGAYEETVFLYDAKVVKGELIERTHEGPVVWMNEEELLASEGLARNFLVYHKALTDPEIEEVLIDGEDITYERSTR